MLPVTQPQRQQEGHTSDGWGAVIAQATQAHAPKRNRMQHGSGADLLGQIGVPTSAGCPSVSVKFCGIEGLGVSKVLSAGGARTGWAGPIRAVSQTTVTRMKTPLRHGRLAGPPDHIETLEVVHMQSGGAPACCIVHDVLPQKRQIYPEIIWAGGGQELSLQLPALDAAFPLIQDLSRRPPVTCEIVGLHSSPEQQQGRSNAAPEQNKEADFWPAERSGEPAAKLGRNGQGRGAAKNVHGARRTAQNGATELFGGSLWPRPAGLGAPAANAIADASDSDSEPDYINRPLDAALKGRRGRGRARGAAKKREPRQKRPRKHIKRLYGDGEGFKAPSGRGAESNGGAEVVDLTDMWGGRLHN